MNGLEGMEIYEWDEAPLIFILTVKNTTQQPLRYTEMKYRFGESAYQVDVRGGPLERVGSYPGGYGNIKVPIAELLNTQAPFSLYGAHIYKERRGSILPLTPPSPSPGVPMLSMDTQWPRELLPGVPEVFTVNVDKLYDFTLGGLYRVSVRHLFPVYQPGDPNDDTTRRWDWGIRAHEAVPGLYEPAVSNEIDVRVWRSAMELVQ